MGCLARALPFGAAAWIAVGAVALAPSEAVANCSAPFSSAQEMADAIHVYGGLLFVGVIRPHWFSTSLVEVEHVFEGHSPTRFVAVGPYGGPEGGIRDLIVGRSYVFWVNPKTVPMYSFGCDGPADPPPGLLALLGPGESPPAFSPVDLLVIAEFVWWSAYLLVTPAVAAIALLFVARLRRRLSTS